mmetsp:Transcript_40011/g.106158  ORF Transcript_40011/g.106158 Transcript_40011/m.106158 type:complete len:218 (+) Transcript_40011:113-766(+)
MGAAPVDVAQKSQTKDRRNQQETHSYIITGGGLLENPISQLQHQSSFASVVVIAFGKERGRVLRRFRYMPCSDLRERATHTTRLQDAVRLEPSCGLCGLHVLQQRGGVSQQSVTEATAPQIFLHGLEHRGRCGGFIPVAILNRLLGDATGLHAHRVEQRILLVKSCGRVAGSTFFPNIFVGICRREHDRVRYDHFNRTNQRHKEARPQDTHDECPDV